MLGQEVIDPEGLEGAAGTEKGLGLLDVRTKMTADKRLTQVRARHVPSGLEVDGYEIHIGRTEGADCARPFAMIGDQADGAISADGRIVGSYLHGMFTDDAFRRAYLAGFGVRSVGPSYGAVVEETLDKLADHMEAHLDVDGLLALAR